MAMQTFAHHLDPLPDLPHFNFIHFVKIKTEKSVFRHFGEEPSHTGEGKHGIKALLQSDL